MCNWCAFIRVSGNKIGWHFRHSFGIHWHFIGSSCFQGKENDSCVNEREESVYSEKKKCHSSKEKMQGDQK